MTPLAGEFARRIRLNGPITVAEYMAECLTHPEHGYYTTRDPLGAAGDFTTAPEISQMFGELIGLCLAQCWLAQGAPPAFALAELGPGRGTLMADIMRATRNVPGFHDAASLHLVEASPRLRTEQARRLGNFDPVWHGALPELPDSPLYLVANEFFDALPVRQFVRHGRGWSERIIGLGPDGELVFGLGPATPLAALDHRIADTQNGDLVEYAPVQRALAGQISARVAEAGGAALIVDYGGWRSLGDTLQALRGHAPADPLETPGEADLTTHVDFEAIAAEAEAAGAAHSQLTRQGVFLERLGITTRAKALAGSLSGPALDQHIAAHRRLTHPSEMGDLFKVMAIYPKNAAPPPGLEP